MYCTRSQSLPQKEDSDSRVHTPGLTSVAIRIRIRIRIRIPDRIATEI